MQKIPRVTIITYTKKFLAVFTLSCAFFTYSFSQITQIQATPQIVEQGNVVEILLPTITAQQVRSISVLGLKNIIPVSFTKNGITTFLVPIDLTLPTKEYTVRVVSITGRTREVKIQVTKRNVPRVDFMPDVDHTATSSDPNTSTNPNLLNNLAKENIRLKNLPSNNRIIWKDPSFIWPIKDKVIITDTYGYTRSAGQILTTHKGLDFRAATGTSVYSMQRGIVRIAEKFTVYGNTVVIDHGKGIHTLYMHLDSISVQKNKLIEQGVEIGKSGQTGYSFGAHLHLSIWMHGIAVDPLSFMSLFNKKADEFAL